MKLRFCYREHNSTQNGIFEEKIVTSLWPVRNDIVMDFTQKNSTYFGMKKESGKQRELTFTNSAATLKEYHST